MKVFVIFKELGFVDIANEEFVTPNGGCVILGNLFVMGVEGLLVGIQILRLEFYEIFNRFYSGNGKGFRPIEITFETEN